MFQDGHGAPVAVRSFIHDVSIPNIHTVLINSRILVSAFLAAVLLASCGKSHTDEGTLARVGSEKLTMENAQRDIDTSQGPVNRQLPKYIGAWVNDELLYQEAQRKGIEKSDQFRKRMEGLQRQLAVQALLQQTVYSDTEGLDDAAVKAYFDAHASEFFVRENMMKLNIIGFTSRDLASEFAAGMAQDNSWQDAVQRAKNTDASSIIAIPSNQYYAQRTLFPPELWKVAGTLNINEVSFPIKTNLGYFLIQLLGVIPQGKAGELDVVRDEVRGRMLIERRRQKYQEFLGSLRKRNDVEIFFNSVSPDDTTQYQTHE